MSVSATVATKLGVSPLGTPPGAAADSTSAPVLLRDGTTLTVRTARPDDEPGLRAFLRTLSGDARHLRFGGALGDDALARESRREAHADGVDGLALVGCVGADDRIVAHAEYVRTSGDRAEVAFTVADAYQGHGLATLLLVRLTRHAAEHGVRVFDATVLPENHAMLAVFRESGFDVRSTVAPGEIRVELLTASTPGALARFEEREWTSAANAVRACLHPRSVAVVGASRRRGTIGGEVLHNLLAYGFVGPVFPVNAASNVVQSVVAYPSVADVPGPVDLAVVVVPAGQVLAVAEVCARKGVRALVVISAGFAETGLEGRARQETLLQVCRSAGMRLVGPNCMGVVNTDPAVRLDATFAPAAPPAGRVGFMSQSGALGIAVIDHAASLGLGLSSFVSVGNKADISGNDLLRYWADDPRTDVVLLYLESFGNSRVFSRIARRVARQKPIVAVKSGRSPAGARAAGSHTGALLAASDVTVDALFRSAGVIRTDTLGEMFDVAALLACRRVPNGNRVAILTNAGGPGILCADACVAEGLDVPPLAEATQAALRGLLAPEASVRNPVDMIASASAEQYREAIRVLCADPAVDAVVVIFIPPLVTRAADVARAIADGVRSASDGKPVVAVFMQSDGAPSALRDGGVRVPVYAFPENAAIALAHAARYGAWCATPEPAIASPSEVRRDEAAAIIAGALGRNERWLGPADVAALLGCYGLPIVEQRVASTPDVAGAVATALGGPVALKAVAPGLLHKSDAGAVRLGLSAAEVTPAACEIERRLCEQGLTADGFVVQRMAPRGVEMIVGMVHDPQFGPVVACGAGGVLVELLKDVAVRLTPIGDTEAATMVRELRTYPLLAGYRGAAPCDVGALEDVIVRVGALVDDLPQLAELDLNPVVVHAGGAVIVDARVRVAVTAVTSVRPTRSAVLAQP